MGLHDYTSDATRPGLVDSPHESRRSGLRVGRLACGLHTDWDHFDPATVIAGSDYDLVVLRYPSSQVAVAEQLQVPGLRSWIADTLLYFSVEVAAVATPDPGTRLTQVDALDAAFDALLDVTFEGYQNHYASNSHLQAISVSEAYVDWVRNQVAGGTGGCYGYWAADDALAGLGVLEAISEGANEWTLGGVHPGHRGHGAYAQIIRHLARVTAEQGRTELVTSTQTSNLPSMRAWCREGFLPTLSLNTIHVMPER